jgi:hypothetical protein
MPQGLWVEHITNIKTHIEWIPIKECEAVAQFIKEIKEDIQLAIPKNAEVTLFGLSGTAIRPTESTSVLIPGNSPESPLRTRVLVAPRPAPNDSNPVLDPELTSFWNSLRDIKDERGFLHLRIRPEFFPEKLKSLYIRKAYEDLFKIIYNNLDSDNETKERIHRMAITGTPGTGKSVFLFYILWRLANVETMKTVILHRQKDDKKIYVFQNDGCWIAFDDRDIRNLLDDPSTWYLTNSLLPPPGYVPAVTILVSSPGKQYYSAFLKLLPNELLHYLPIWSLEELKIVAPFYLKTPEEIEDRFGKIGGSAQYVLEEDKDLEATIDYGISKIVSSKYIPMPLKEGYNEYDIINRIIHFEVRPPDYIRYKLTIASDYVARKFSERLHDRHELELIYFLTFFDNVSFVGPTVGHLFESYAHRKLSAGGEFLVRSLDDDIEEKMSFPPRQPMTFGNFSECKNPNIYYKPQARNFACIDSLILGTGYFQTTISMEHKIAEERMKEIKKVMKMDKLYFVVPHTKYKEFKKQELTKEKKNNNNGDD